MAVAGFQCVKCGEIPKNEFSPDVRSQMSRGSTLLVFGAIGVFGAVIAILIALNS
jgi:hypothetical protein